ncbi:MAG: hypothetical protein OIF50_03600 [Flavobacteriaceae bacterium]|nr:hypothetical protein [Flavobacteriaceae bacterium]
MRNFLISLLFIIGMQSCSLKTVAGLQEKVQSAEIKNPYFQDSKDYVYKAKLNIYGHYAGGLLVLKKLGVSHYRYVFVSEFGSKMFDFERKQNNFKTHFVLEEFNRPMFISLLQKDLHLLTMEKLKANKIYQTGKQLYYRRQEKKQSFFYVMDTKRQQLKQVLRTSKTKEKVIFDFEEVRNQVPYRFHIQHKDVKLRIDLNYVKS